MKSVCQRNISTPTVTAVSFTTAKIHEQPTYSLMNKRKIEYPYRIQYYFARKKNRYKSFAANEWN